MNSVRLNPKSMNRRLVSLSSRAVSLSRQNLHVHLKDWRLFLNSFCRSS